MSESTAIQVWNSPEWNDAKIATFKKAIAPPTASDSEIAYFVDWSKRTGLDPFLKQCFLIERGSMVNNKWVTKHEPMASESGVAARADALVDYRGIRAAAVYLGDLFEVDEQLQTVKHIWSLTTRKEHENILLGAWAHVVRADKITPIVFLDLATRIQKTKEGKVTKFWERDPAGMILKCARMAAYRVAYPNVFGSCRISEELDSDDEIISVNQSNELTTDTSKTDELNSEFQALVGLINAAPSEAALRALVTRITVLPEREKNLIRAEFGKRLEVLRHVMLVAPQITETTK